MIVAGVDSLIGALPGSAASSRVTLAVWGLIGLAIVIAVVTVVFWKLTRPESPSAGRTIVRPAESDDAASAAH